MLPTSRLRRPAAALAALGLAAGALLAAPASPATADPSTATSAATSAARSVGKPAAPLRYVALGDSYSAASGVLPLDPAAPPACLRSTRNYPHVVAERLGARLVDVTCGAAETGDYFSAQYPGVPRQLDALGRGTQLVTMTIGGNDSGVFIGAILACGVAGATTLGTGSPCKDANGSRFVDTVRETTYPSLVRALKAVHRNAPRADVAILGYPQIVPATGGCYPQMPVATGDVPYLHRLQAVLNNAVRRAARKTGSVYVDVPKASVGHDACQAIGTRWVEPVVAGTNPVIVHPNARGEARMAALTIKRLRRR